MGYFRDSVAGVTKKNPDGEDRQRLIVKYAKAGAQVELRREPDNSFDRNAIGVWIRKKGLFSSKMVQIGYVPAQWATDLAAHLDSGKSATAEIVDRIGGGQGKTFGVIIKVDAPGCGFRKGYGRDF